LSCLFWLLAGAWPELCHADTIYFHKDKHGVFHFTDTPRSQLYRPFLFLRDRTSKADKRAIVRYVEQYGRLHGVDPHLIMAVIEVESAFNPTAVSRAGAQGLMQIMPQTQQDLGLTAPFDARDNIEAGIRYLRMLMDRFPSLPLALAAYNAGPGAVERYRGIPPFQETRDYVRRVMSNYDRRRSAQN
jgi:soluble lytic murein transglycosylase-like protein